MGALLDVIAWVVVVGGILLMFFSAGVGGLGSMRQDMEVPLGDVDAIAVDKDGNIYCATHTYDRIQIYDSGGHFLRGLFVPMTAFGFKVDADGCVHAWDDYKQYKKFGPTGAVLTEDVRDKPTSLGERRCYVKQALDAEGNTYVVPWYAWCWPAVVKKTPDGTSRVVVSQPLRLWLIKVVFPTIVYTAVGVVYFGIRKSLRRWQTRYVP